MGNCNVPVLDQFFVQYGQILLFQTKICPNWTKSWSETEKLQFPITGLGIFLSASQKFFWVCRKWFSEKFYDKNNGVWNILFSKLVYNKNQIRRKFKIFKKQKRNFKSAKYNKPSYDGEDVIIVKFLFFPLN